jgi:hypothetical protein
VVSLHVSTLDLQQEMADIIKTLPPARCHGIDILAQAMVQHLTQPESSLVQAGSSSADPAPDTSSTSELGTVQASVDNKGATSAVTAPSHDEEANQDGQVCRYSKVVVSFGQDRIVVSTDRDAKVSPKKASSEPAHVDLTMEDLEACSVSSRSSSSSSSSSDME